MTIISYCLYIIHTMLYIIHTTLYIIHTMLYILRTTYNVGHSAAASAWTIDRHPPGPPQPQPAHTHVYKLRISYDCGSCKLRKGAAKRSCEKGAAFACA